MRAIATVFRKEMRENLRDRRALFSAFLFVPLMGPILFSILTTVIVERVVGETDESLRLPVIGAEHAPNLLRFMQENGADVVKMGDDLTAAQALVRSGREHLVLVIPEEIGAQLESGAPAPLDLIEDSSNGKAQRFVSRARTLLQAYSHQLGVLRLLARGIDPSATTALSVRTIDVATPSSRSIVLLGTLTYFVLFSLLLGGLYVAIDVTAGERERGSLEPLLCLPLQREQLVIGKIAATVLFMLLALSLT